MPAPVRWASKGIVLVTTLLMMVLVVMIVTVVVYTGAGGLSLSGNFYEREAALLAADSGLQYAMARLQSNSAWRGDDEGTIPAARPDFSVMEKDGNVYGFLSTAFGHRTQFRIKFNFEDGDDGLDGLSDTVDSNYLLAMPYVSLNNLGGSSVVPLPRGRSDGVGVGPGEAPYLVPRRTACIFVEGLAGWGLRDADADNLKASVSNRSVTRRLVEAYLALDESGEVDSAAYSAGSLTANLVDNGQFKLDSYAKDDPSRIRSLQDITIQSPANKAKLTASKDAEAVVGDGHTFTLNNGGKPNLTVSNGDSSSLFRKLTWSGISKASASSPTDAQLRAGTYLWRVDGDSGQAYLEYYDHEWTSTSTLADLQGGTRVDANSLTIQGTGVRLDEASVSIDISNNVYVNASNGGAKGLAILTSPEVTAGGNRPSLSFSPPEGSQKVPVLTASGSVRVQGSATGLGSVTSEGDITLQGPSLLESDPDTGVSLYSKGDINLEGTPSPVAAAQDELLQVMGEILSSITLTDSKSRGLYDAVVNGDYTGLSAYQAQRIQTARSQMSDKQLGQLKKAWNKAIKSGASKELQAFLSRMKKEIVQANASGADQSLTGVVYTWKNFNADIGSLGKLRIRGTLIAYGGDPGDATNSAPGTSPGDGQISITAREVNLTYDPTYIRELMGQGGSVKVKRTLWATY